MQLGYVTIMSGTKLYVHLVLQKCRKSIALMYNELQIVDAKCVVQCSRCKYGYARAMLYAEMVCKTGGIIKKVCKIT